MSPQAGLCWAAWEPPGPAPLPCHPDDSSPMGVTSLGYRELLKLSTHLAPSFLADETKGKVIVC